MKVLKIHTNINQQIQRKYQLKHAKQPSHEILPLKTNMVATLALQSSSGSTNIK